MRLTYLVAGAFFAAALTTADLMAQVEGGTMQVERNDASISLVRVPNRIPITIVMAEGSGPPVLMRRMTGEPRNLILVNPTVSEQQLESAIFAFLLAEARDPAGNERADDAAIRVNLPPTVPRYPGAGAVLRRLASAPYQQVGETDVEHRAVQIWLSARRGHHRVRTRP